MAKTSSLFNQVSNQPQWLHRISLGGDDRTDTLNSLAVLGGCSLIGLLFYLLRLSEANIITIYILGILLISFLTSRRIYGLLASVVGVLLFNCLYAEPRFTLFFYDPQYTITMIIMLVASLGTSAITSSLRYRLLNEQLETRRTEILLETSQQLQQAQDDQALLNVAVTQLYSLFHTPVCLYPLVEGRLQEPLTDSSRAPTADPFTTEERDDLTAWLGGAGYGNTKQLILRKNGQQAFCFRLQSQKKIYALLVLFFNKGERLADYQRNLIYALLDEVALAVEGYELRTHNAQIAQEAQAERLRANLLRTISHDLRTPLTGILGHADILLDKGGQLEPEKRDQLYQSIYDDAEWLIDLVENLLFVTRIENGGMALHREPELLQDIIPEALHFLHKRAKDHRTKLSLPDELLMVRIDSRLFMQVIINLVGNALKHTPAGCEIEVRVFARQGKAVIEVADTGPGIADADKRKIFELFYTANNGQGDARRGIGLGLPLSQSIIQAHGGTIEVRDNLPQGTVFRISLELEALPDESNHSGH